MRTISMRNLLENWILFILYIFFFFGKCVQKFIFLLYLSLCVSINRERQRISNQFCDIKIFCVPSIRREERARQFHAEQESPQKKQPQKKSSQVFIDIHNFFTVASQHTAATRRSEKSVSNVNKEQLVRP